MAPARKRKRAQAFPEPQEDDIVVDVEETPTDVETPEEEHDDHSNDEAQLEKEREVWESFREQYFEAVEQLPLSLHRQYRLLRELDEQAQGYANALLPTVHAYIAHRLSLEPPKPANGPPEPVVLNGNEPPTESTAEPHLAAPTTPISTRPPALRLRSVLQKITQTPLRDPSTLATPMTPRTPIAIPPERTKVPQTSREMLSHLAWLAEELYRTSEEKNNLAKACVDSVDRQVRLIDQAIKDQEYILEHGSQSGGYSRPLVLPEIVVPKYNRPPARASLSPIPGYDDIDVPKEPPPQAPSNSPGNSKPKGKKGKKKQEPPPENLGPRPRKVTLKVSSDRGKASAPELYCYCQKESFGEMVMCDNEAGCQYKWFHLECVGLAKAPDPDEPWACKECTAKINTGTATGRRGRRAAR